MSHLILYADSTDKSDELDRYFKKEEHDTRRWAYIKDVVDELKEKEGICKTVLIWHLTSSYFQGNIIKNIDVLKKAVQYVKDNTSGVDFKLGVSDNHNFYNAAKEIPWFDFADSWYELRNLFKVSNGYSLEEGLRNLPLKKNREKVEQVIHYLLCLFLPLDIDMQALEIIKDNQGEVKNYLWGDKDRDIEGMFEGSEGDEHYRQKLYDLWHLLGKKEYLEQIGKSASSKVLSLTPIDNPSPSIQQLAGLNNRDLKESQIYNFFESLDTAKKNSTDITANDLCKPFKDMKVNDEEIKSFPKWYRALAKELRKLSA